MKIRGVSTDIEHGLHTAQCPFCSIRTAFKFTYGGLMCEYRTKCTHVTEVTHSRGVMVFYECSTADAPSSSLNSAESQSPATTP